MTVKEGTYMVMWFYNQDNPKEGISTKLFDSVLDVHDFIRENIKGDHLILKCASTLKNKDNWVIVKLNYSKSNIWKIFKK